MKEEGGGGRIELDKLRPLLYGSIKREEETETESERAELHNCVRTSYKIVDHSLSESP